MHQLTIISWSTCRIRGASTLLFGKATTGHCSTIILLNAASIQLVKNIIAYYHSTTPQRLGCCSQICEQSCEHIFSFEYNESSPNKHHLARFEQKTPCFFGLLYQGTSLSAASVANTPSMPLLQRRSVGIIDWTRVSTPQLLVLLLKFQFESMSAWTERKKHLSQPHRIHGTGIFTYTFTLKINQPSM